MAERKLGIVHRLAGDCHASALSVQIRDKGNAESHRKNCLENIHTYLALCMQYRAPIFVGSDAHDPSQVGSFDEAIALLDEIGFDEDLILNNSEVKFRRFIGMPTD